MTTPSSRFENEDTEVQYWLGVLRDGSDDQKIAARSALARVFEQRNMYEEATDLLISNIQAGFKNADIFRWLARLYRAQGEEVLSMQAAAEAAKNMTSAVLVADPPLAPAGLPRVGIVQPTRKASVASNVARFPLILIGLLAAGLMTIILVSFVFRLTSPNTTSSATSASSTPRPDPAQARYVDPRQLAANPESFSGQNIVLEGKSLNVTQNQASTGLLGGTQDYTWMQVMAIVKDRNTTESVVVEFYPRQTSIIKDECYRVFGIAQGSTKVRRTLTGAEDSAPLIRGYMWTQGSTDRFGSCIPQTDVPATSMAADVPATALYTFSNDGGASSPAFNLSSGSYVFRWSLMRTGPQSSCRFVISLVRAEDRSVVLDLGAQELSGQPSGSGGQRVSVSTPGSFMLSSSGTCHWQVSIEKG
jgi:hypothetical protein